MIDFIDECSYDFQKLGYKKIDAKKYNIELLSLHVNNAFDSKSLGFDMGDYFIINSPLINLLDKECFNYTSRLLKSRLKYLFKKFKINRKEKVLVVGLGNPDIWADRLGVEVCRNLQLQDFNKNIYKFCPNVYFETGIKTFDLVESIIKKVEANLVIVVDALCTNSLSRLGVSLQLTSSGMTPGSAMGLGNKKICEETVGIPCFSIGVPFMINAKTFGSKQNIMLSPKDIRENVKNLAYIISKAIKESLLWIIIYSFHFF